MRKWALKDRLTKKIGRGVLYRVAGLTDKLLNRIHYGHRKHRDIIAQKEVYQGISEEAKAREYPQIDAYESEKDISIDRQWFHELALHTQVVIKQSEICYQHGRLLYAAIRSYIQHSRPHYMNIIETGTALGFSSLCMAKALVDARLDGKIITFDVLPHNVKLYWNCIDDADGPRTRSELLKAYLPLTERYCVYHQGDSRRELPKVRMSRIHFAFLDGLHTYRAVMKEFECIGGYQSQGDMIFYDDYTSHLFPGVVKAVDEICSCYGYSREIFKANKNRVYLIGTKQ